MTEHWRHPEAIVSADWLADHLSDPDLRLYECTTHLRYGELEGAPYRVESGHADWASGHIPGANYLDLQADFSNPSAPTSFMRLTPQEIAEAFARHGVDQSSRVVLYARGSPQWATRFWWLLRWIGFDNAAVLDGGFETWVAQNRALALDSSPFPAGKLEAKLRPGLFVDREEVLAAMADGSSCLLNALGPELHRGENPRYGRPGRIPGSTNVPAASLVHPELKTFRTPQEVSVAFTGAGAMPDAPVLNYCGGGIAATLDAFLQWQLGYEGISVYDASMSEWAKDPTLPIETETPN